MLYLINTILKWRSSSNVFTYTALEVPDVYASDQTKKKASYTWIKVCAFRVELYIYKSIFLLSSSANAQWCETAQFLQRTPAVL